MSDVVSDSKSTRNNSKKCCLHNVTVKHYANELRYISNSWLSDMEVSCKRSQNTHKRTDKHTHMHTGRETDTHIHPHTHTNNALFLEKPIKQFIFRDSALIQLK